MRSRRSAPRGSRLSRSGGGCAIPALTRKAIKDYLKVSRPDKAALTVAISFRAGTPEEAIRFVDGIIRSYEQFLEEKSKDGNHQVIALVSKVRDELGRQLGQLEAKYLEFQQSHPHLLELVNDGAGHPILGSRLQELERAANESALKALKLKSQLDLGRKLAEQGPELWSIAFAIAQLGGDPGAAPVAPSPGAAWPPPRTMSASSSRNSRSSWRGTGRASRRSASSRI